MTPAQAKQYLDSFINYENNFKEISPRTFKLQRVHELLRRIDFPFSKNNGERPLRQAQGRPESLDFARDGERVERVEPQMKCVEGRSRTIHIAGTKGKGSTCAFVASILVEAGYKVGLYTSPHLSDFKERIRILKPFASSKNSGDAFAGKITERDFARTLTKMKPAVEQVNRALTPARLRDPSTRPLGSWFDWLTIPRTIPSEVEGLRVSPPRETPWRLSYFEVLTVLAVYYFHLKEVDFIILETGLGGRLDATNVFKSHICALTPISLEHTQQLGSTIKAIAQEKAAIIKDNHQIAVIAPQPALAERVIKNRLQQYGVKSVWVGKDIGYKSISQQMTKQIFRLKTSTNDYPRLETKLLGEHQLINAAVAVGVGEALSSFGFKISKSAVTRGIANVRWPGRFEILKKKPFVILDGAHNPASARTLAKTIQDIFREKKVVLILGMSEDKDRMGIVRELNKIAKRIIFTQANHPRAWAFNEEELKGLLPHKEILRTQKVQEALKEALHSAGKDDVILICGSLFVVGEARECLIKEL